MDSHVCQRVRLVQACGAEWCILFRLGFLYPRRCRVLYRLYQASALASAKVWLIFLRPLWVLWTFALAKDPVFFDLPWVFAWVLLLLFVVTFAFASKFLLLLLPSLRVFCVCLTPAHCYASLVTFFLEELIAVVVGFGVRQSLPFILLFVEPFRWQRTCVYCGSGSLKKCLLS